MTIFLKPEIHFKNLRFAQGGWKTKHIPQMVVLMVINPMVESVKITTSNSNTRNIQPFLLSSRSIVRGNKFQRNIHTEFGS